MSDTRPMTPEQAATLKRLARDAYELDAFKPKPHTRRGGYSYRDVDR
jgi:hypothetical protein